MLDIEEKTRRGRKYGLKHGYFSMPGGYIYKEGREKPVCQGWYRLYEKIPGAVERWFEQQEREKAEKKRKG